MPACALTISASGQKRDPLAVRQAVPAAPEDELRIVLDRRLQLVDEARLADPGHADEGDELHRALSPGPGERVAEQLHLVHPPDERNPAPLEGIERRRASEPPTASHADDRLRLPFRLHRLDLAGTRSLRAVAR